MTPTTKWYLKKKNNTQYGPVSLEEMAIWAEQCRIVSGNQASTDRENWINVEDIPELAMDWLARRKDGKQYGPFPLSALPELLNHRVLPKDAVLTHRDTDETMTMQEALDASNRDDDSEEPDEIEIELTSLQEQNAQQQKAFERQLSALQQEIDGMQEEWENQQENARQMFEQTEQKYQARIEELHDALQQALDDKKNIRAQENNQQVALSELRQQIAFMKKNIAALNAQLLTARNTAKQRATMLSVAWVTVTITIAALLVLLLGKGCSDTDPKQPAAPQSPAPITETPHNEMLPPIGNEPAPAPEPPSAQSTPAANQTMRPLQIDVPGITIVAQNNRNIQLRFDNGIFSSLDTLSPEGRQLLDDLARQLPRNLAGWKMKIEGHTDNVPMRSTNRFENNEALARARARAAMTHLMERAAFPANALQAQAGTQAPYPNDTADNRIRNRTITIEISPR